MFIEKEAQGTGKKMGGEDLKPSNCEPRARSQPGWLYYVLGMRLVLCMYYLDSRKAN